MGLLHAQVSPIPAADPNDIAPAAVFLASDDARYVTGETLNVDAGMLHPTRADCRI